MLPELTRVVFRILVKYDEIDLQSEWNSYWNSVWNTLDFQMKQRIVPSGGVGAGHALLAPYPVEDG